MLTLTNARLFDGRKALPGRHSVTIDGARIAAVGERPHTGADNIIDLDGMTLMPGLITGHLHPDMYKFNIGHNSNGVMVGTEMPPGVLMTIAARTCGVLLESGFTGYIGASCSNDIDAQLKISIAEGIMKGPRIRACGHHIGTTASLNDHKKWWLRTEIRGQDLFADGADDLRKLVREDIRRGAQTIKIFASSGHGFPGYPTAVRNMSREEIAAVVNAAHERGAKVRAHVAGPEMILECLELGVDIIDHGDLLDDACVEAMVKVGAYWVPSLRYLQTLHELGWADTDVQAEYANARRMLPVAHRAGVKILIGDDYSGVFRDVVKDDPLDHQVGNYGREFAFYADFEGVTPADVLAWGTANPGELLSDGAAKAGVIEAGALADLIVIDGDPLADLSLLHRPEESLKAVIRDGALVIDRLPSAQRRMVA